MIWYWTEPELSHPCLVPCINYLLGLLAFVFTLTIAHRTHAPTTMKYSFLKHLCLVWEEKRQQPQKLKQHRLLLIICKSVSGLHWEWFYWFSLYDSRVTLYSFFSVKRHPSVGSKGLLGPSKETGSFRESLCSYFSYSWFTLNEGTLKIVCIELVVSWSVAGPAYSLVFLSPGHDPLLGYGRLQVGSPIKSDWI